MVQALLNRALAIIEKIVRDRSNRGVQAWIRYRGPRLNMERQYASPYVECVILLVIERRTGSNLGRSFADREGENLGGLEFLLGGPADVVPPPRHDLFGDRAERSGFFFRRLYEGRRSKQDDRSIIHRMVEGGAGEHKPIEQSDCDTDLDACGHRAKHTAGSGTMQVKSVTEASVAGRDDEGLAIDHETRMA